MAASNRQPDAEPRQAAELTIDELAERVGMTVRNLREWRTLGLLPRARMQGRVGYYDEQVVERLERVKRLHSEGFTLELISRMLAAGGELGDEVMRLAGSLRSPLQDSPMPVAEAEQWAAAWGSTDPELVERAIALGVMRRGTDGSLEFTSLRIAEIGAALGELGLSPEQILASTEALRAHADAMAEHFEGVWREHIWEPFVAAGMPAEQLPAIQQAAARVRPLAFDSVAEVFKIAMESRIESSIAAELERVRGAGPGTQPSP